MMINLRVVTWGYFALWVTGGLLLYLVYSRRHSRLGRELRATSGLAAPTVPATRPRRGETNKRVRA